MRNIAWVIFFFMFACRTPQVSKSLGDDFANPAGDNDRAWFPDPAREVNYCVNLAANFGVSKGRAIALIEESISTWREYLATRQTIAKYFNSTRYKVQPVCGENVDLRFELGARDGDLAKIVETINGPAGQHVLAGTEEGGWSQGIVWLASEKSQTADFPNWSSHENAALKGALLHQLGHVLGVGHVEGTIMSKEFNLRFLKTPEAFLPLLTSIDWDIALARAIQYSGSTSFLKPQHEGKRKLLFEKIAGTAPAGPVTSRLEISNVNEITLTLADGVKTVSRKFMTPKLKRKQLESGFTVYAKSLADLKTKAPNLKVEDVAFDPVAKKASDNNFGTEVAKLDQVPTAVKMVLEINSTFLTGSPIVVYYELDGKRYEVFRAPTSWDRLEPTLHPFRNGIMMD
ncbi:MAG: hypothetical protein AB7T49_03965 [Oligoflexales bacterium]